VNTVLLLLLVLLLTMQSTLAASIGGDSIIEKRPNSIC